MKLICGIASVKYSDVIIKSSGDCFRELLVDKTEEKIENIFRITPFQISLKLEKNLINQTFHKFIFCFKVFLGFIKTCDKIILPIIF